MKHANVKTPASNKTIKVTLKVLTPVHVGDGTTITNWDYGIEGDTLKVYSLDQILKEAEQKLQPKSLEEFAKKLKAEISNHPLDKCLGEFQLLKAYGLDNPLYEIPLRIKWPLKQKRVDRRTNIQREEYKPIFSYIKSLGKPYIPGTELKGAFRTAFAYFLLNTNSHLQNWLIKEINTALRAEDKRRIKQELSKLGKKLEQILFEAHDARGSNPDAKKDGLKTVYFTDSDLKEPSETLEVRQLFLLNTRRRFPLYAETLKVGTQFRTIVGFSPEKFSALVEYWKVENPSVDILKLLEKEGFKTGFKAILKRFYTDLLQEEEKYFSNPIRNYPEPLRRKTLDTIKQLQREIQQGKVLIRIGRFTGFLSHTVGLFLKRKYPDLYSEIYPYLVPRGYDWQPNKTRWVDGEGNPLGWIELKFN